MHNRFLLSISALVLALGSMSGVSAAGNIDVVRSYVNKGNASMRARNFPEAIKQYEEALKEDPGNPVAKQNIAEAHNNWGISFYGQRKFQEALQEWNKCLELSPNHANARRNIAILNKIADQQGLDLTSSSKSAAGKGDHVEDQKGKPAEVGKLVPKEAPVEQTAGAVLILGGSRTLVGTGASTSGSGGLDNTGASAAQPYATAQPSASNSSSQIVAPAQTPVSPAPSWRAAPSSSLFPALPSQFVDTAVGVRPGAGQAGATAETVSPVVPSSSGGVPQFGPSGGRPAGNSLEDQLGAVELKIYGQRQTELTVIQRLEKIEKDTAGQVRSGTIVDRIDYLKQNYGLR